jgi:hypothetical protein
LKLFVEKEIDSAKLLSPKGGVVLELCKCDDSNLSPVLVSIGKLRSHGEIEVDLYCSNCQKGYLAKGIVTIYEEEAVLDGE